MSSDRFVHDAVGTPLRLEPCAPFNSGVDVHGDAQITWDVFYRSFTISNDRSTTTVSGASYDAIEPLKEFVSVHFFGNDFVLCLPKFKDIKRDVCPCNFANYGFMPKGRIRLDKMACNLDDPSDWELDILDILDSHGKDKLSGRLIGERWGIFAERCDEILALPLFTSLFDRLSRAPTHDDMLVEKVTSDMRKLLTGKQVLQQNGAQKLGLIDLLKVLACTRLVDPKLMHPNSLWISAISAVGLMGCRGDIYDAASICKSRKIDAIPRRDICKLAVLPNTAMLLGEINGTNKQQDLLRIVAKPYQAIKNEKGEQILEENYRQLKEFMSDYYNRFCFKDRDRANAGDVLRKASTMDFEPFVSWWQNEQVKGESNRNASGGTVEVPMRDSWTGADIIDCFALGVLTGSARLAEYLPIQVRMAMVMGLEKKIFDKVTRRCVWHNRGRSSQREKKRIAYLGSSLAEVSGEAIVRPDPVSIDEILRNVIKERTRSVSEEYVLVSWPRPKPIAILLLLAFALMCVQLVFDRQKEDNIFSVASRAVTNFIGISFVLSALVIKLVYNDWALYDMWRGQRQVTDLSLFAKSVKKTYPEVVLSLRQSGIWNRAISDTNACLILKDKKQKGGVVMKRGLYVRELLENNFLLPCDTTTLLLPHNGEELELYGMVEEGTYHYSEAISGPAMTSYCSTQRKDHIVGSDTDFFGLL